MQAILLYCCASLYPIWIKYSVIRRAFKTSLETRLERCIYKTSLLHQPDDYIGFIPSCLPHILQQNCARVIECKATFALAIFPNSFAQRFQPFIVF